MNTEPWPDYRPVGDGALVVEFGDLIDPAINQRVQAFAQQLGVARLPGVTDIVPTYRSLLVHYDPLRLSYNQVTAWARAQSQPAAQSLPASRRCVEIPTVYGGEYGSDLDFVAGYHHVSPADIIRWHSGAKYTVYMMGFMPGFPYLGGLPPELETPRLETPRTLVRAGSVGIAGPQTGIYPLDSPGGWRIIGRTTMKLFDPALDPPALLAPGDLVRFVPVSPGEG